MNRPLTGHATATVTSTKDKFGPLTTAAIQSLLNDDARKRLNAAAAPGVDIKAAWFNECPIGPSDWYTNTRPLQMGRVTVANGTDKLTIADIDKAIQGVASMRVTKPAPMQVGGTHYARLAIDPFKYGMENKLDPLQFSVIKYVTRFRDKNGIQDLRKAIDCLERLIAHEESKK